MVRMKEFPLFSFPLLKVVFISSYNLFFSSFTIILFRDEFNQIIVGINSNPTAVLVHFKGRLLISVVGPKIENRFLITFEMFFLR